MKFEDNLSKKIDMSKVKIDVLKPWITKRVYEMLKMEDDVVVEFIFNQLEDEKVCILIVIVAASALLKFVTDWWYYDCNVRCGSYTHNL